MDGRGARYLMTRILAGAREGDRVELVSSPEPGCGVEPGHRGVVTLIDEEAIRVRWDCGLDFAVSPRLVRLRVVHD